MLALGSDDHNRAELYTFATGEWSATAAYPFRPEISWPGLVEMGGDFYSFGGLQRYGVDMYGDMMNEIARFSPRSNKWTQLGQLNVARESAAVTIINNAFYIVGGGTERPSNWDKVTPTEKCTLVGTSGIECVNISNTQAFLSPAAFAVPDDFC